MLPQQYPDMYVSYGAMTGLGLCRPCAEDPLSTLLWANKVAIERFGHIRPRAEQGQHLANADPEFVADRQRRITLSEQEVLVSHACSFGVCSESQGWLRQKLILPALTCRVVAIHYTLC